MPLLEVFGWAAAALTFLTYSQKTMLRLRILGIGANLCFIIWSLAFGVYPTLVLHAALLPVNTYRLLQILWMRRDAVRAQGDPVAPLDWLRPLVRPAHFRDSQYVFHKGDAPDCLYYLVSGKVTFDEIGRSAGPGEIFGELAFLTSRRERTASARCEGDCEVLALDAGDLATLSLQHPEFNLYIMRVLAGRLAGGERIRADLPPEPIVVTDQQDP